MNKENEKLISIIMPTYNGASSVARAIQSVFAQSFTDFEFIIIDDGSVDDTEKIVQEITKNDKRVRYYKNVKNLGVQKTRNLALDLSVGKYIAEIDQDDVWLNNDKLSKQVKFLEENPDYVLIGTGVVVVGEDGKEIARYLMPATDAEIRQRILRANCFIHSSVMYRKSLVQQVGYYTVEKMSEDHDLWLRLGRVGKFANFGEYAVQYRFSPKGYNSQDKIIRLKQNLDFIKEHRDFYPNYLQAYVLGWLKIVTYPLFRLLPVRLKGLLLKLHKKVWLGQ